LSKATLIWFRGPEKPFRTYPLSKQVIYAVVGSFAFLALLSITLMAVTSYQSDKIADLRKIEAELDSSTKQLEDLQAQKVILEQDQQAAQEELDRVRNMETQVRRFLGLETDEVPEELSNQGGTPSTTPGVDPLPDSLIERELPPLETRKSQATVEDGLAEVLDFLQGKQKNMRGIPTLIPVEGNDLWISCDFGWRTNPITGVGKEFHNGLDIAGHWKSPIIAPADAVVIRSGKDKYLGEYVKLRHPSGILTSYGHMSKRAVKNGEKVERGDVIGYMGNTGRTTGTHVHYAVVKDDRYVDPSQYIWDGPNNTLVSRK
jgi:murein DD-endopeptidase MepM/ murein hydrolase activator NlpD